MRARYFYTTVDGFSGGPVDAISLSQMFDNARIAPDCLVRPEGGEEWVPLSKVISTPPQKPIATTITIGGVILFAVLMGWLSFALHWTSR